MAGHAVMRFGEIPKARSGDVIAPKEALVILHADLQHTSLCQAVQLFLQVGQCKFPTDHWPTSTFSLLRSSRHSAASISVVAVSPLQTNCVGHDVTLRT